MHVHRRFLFAAVLLAVTACVAPSRLPAAEPDSGFSTIVRPSITGEELTAQKDVWALEVAVKPMRMVFVQVNNPRTGAKTSEIVWYLVYKVVNRAVPPRANAADSTPVNAEDAPPAPVFVPRAVLVTEDRDIHKSIVDSIVPEALPLIIAREQLDVKTPVQIAGPLPKPATPEHENAEYGVFMFRGVDPRTTAFTVYLSGFSSAYKIGKDAAGKPVVLRRTIVLPYRRLADEFDQFEREIKQQGETKWIYLPDEPVAATK